MPNVFLYDMPILPKGFVFPQTYLDIVKADKLIDLEPWSFLCKDMAMSLHCYGNLLDRYNNYPFIPFARIDHDRHDVLASFDGYDTSGDPKVYCSNDADWSKQDRLDSFSAWLESAKKETALYKVRRRF